MRRIRQAIENAGGLNVWVKTPNHNGNPAALRADVPLEVLTTPAAFDAVFAAAAHEARKHKDEIHVKKIQDRPRVAEVRVARQGDLIGGIRLREVRELFRAAIVIDDLGQDLGTAHGFLELPSPVTLSILPLLRHSSEIAEEAHRAGHEIMLHLPMEPEPGSSTQAGLGQIRVGMASSEVARIIQKDLDSVPYSAGVNNHMGSRATADAALMAAVMQFLAERHLYFVDSRTTRRSVALDIARQNGLAAFYRSVFLDDEEEVDYTLEKLREFRRLVEEHGVALAIGHPYPTTLAALTQFLPEFERAEIQLVPASQLVRLPEVARLSPPRKAVVSEK